jgi:iron(III) transport system ATP-binding protein
MTILSARQITKTYPGTQKPALNGFSMEVHKGEIVALLGESGCGKTTALRILAGFEKADEGTLSIQNTPIFDQQHFTDPSRRGVGIIFQDYALFPHQSVWQNVTFGLHKKKPKEQKSMASEIIDLVGLSGYEHRYPHQLSGGQQQRVALARAMAPRPQILLMDEPFSNIDTVKKNQIREELHGLLKKTGVTVIFVTHDTRDVMAIADRVVVLKEGHLLQQGTPEAVFKRPANSYLAHFFGTTNLIKGQVVDGRIQTGLGSILIPGDQGLPEGDKVSLSLRPGDIHLSTATDQRAIRVKIEQLRFMGEFTEATGRIEATGLKLLFNLPPNKSPNGDTAYLQIPEKAFQLLPDNY